MTGTDGWAARVERVGEAIDVEQMYATRFTASMPSDEYARAYREVVARPGRVLVEIRHPATNAIVGRVHETPWGAAWVERRTYSRAWRQARYWESHQVDRLVKGRETIVLVRFLERELPERPEALARLVPDGPGAWTAFLAYSRCGLLDAAAAARRCAAPLAIRATPALYIRHLDSEG